MTVASVKTQCERLGMDDVERKRTFDATYKLKVIDYASQYSNRAVAWMHRIDEKRVQLE